jgi:flagellar biosynthesis GTPase FlhF
MDNEKISNERIYGNLALLRRLRPEPGNGVSEEQYKSCANILLFFNLLPEAVLKKMLSKPVDDETDEEKISEEQIHKLYTDAIRLRQSFLDPMTEETEEAEEEKMLSKPVVETDETDETEEAEEEKEEAEEEKEEENEKMRELKNKLKLDLMSISANSSNMKDCEKAHKDYLEKNLFEIRKQILAAKIDAVPENDAGVAKVGQLFSVLDS